MHLPGYEDVVLIAHGGFATVYRARQVAFERDVAVKVLTVELDQARDRSRFEREVAAMGRLTGHPHIVTILDSGFTPDGRPYLTTPFYAQGSLGQQLIRSGPFPVREVLEIGVAMAGALDAAHQRGILHRDVKPENILLSSYGESALTDFGIATDVAPGSSSSTLTTQAFTLGHAPPEVLEGGRATEASDVYSLASSLWMLLTGRTPFGGAADEGLIPRVLRVKTEPVPPIGRTDVPPSLERCLQLAMAKDPAERCVPMAAFGRALQVIQRELDLPVTELRTESVVDLRTAPFDVLASDAAVVVAPRSPAPDVARWQGANTRAATPTAVDLWAEPAWRDERRLTGATDALVTVTAFTDPGPTAVQPTAVESAATTTVASTVAPSALTPNVGVAGGLVSARVEPTTAARSRSRATPEPRRGRPALAVLAVLLMVVVGFGVGFVVMRDRTSVATTGAAPTTTPATTAPTSTASVPVVDPAAAAPETNSSSPASAVPTATRKPGEVIAPADLPAPAGQAAGVAQQAASALAAADWDRARALVPSLRSADDGALDAGWGGLDQATLVVTDWRDAPGGAVTLRLGEIAHERNADNSRRTNLYCVTWTVSGGRIVAMADQQLIGPQPWRAGVWADPAEAADVLMSGCKKL